MLSTGRTHLMRLLKIIVSETCSQILFHLLTRDTSDFANESVRSLRLHFLCLQALCRNTAGSSAATKNAFAICNRQLMSSSKIQGTRRLVGFDGGSQEKEQQMIHSPTGFQESTNFLTSTGWGKEAHCCTARTLGQGLQTIRPGSWKERRQCADFDK
jgi:hypothetical protein